jgi:hypothetical protein
MDPHVPRLILLFRFSYCCAWVLIVPETDKLRMSQVLRPVHSKNSATHDAGFHPDALSLSSLPWGPCHQRLASFFGSFIRTTEALRAPLGYEQDRERFARATIESLADAGRERPGGKGS